MKFGFILSLLCAVSAPDLSAQAGKPKVVKPAAKIKKTNSDKLADKYFDLDEFSRAIEIYEKSVRRKPDDAYSYWKMGECYRNIFQYAKAEEAYSKAEALGVSSVLPLLDYRYGMVLKINGKYDSSKFYLERFAGSFTPMRPSEMGFADEARLELKGSAFAQKELLKQLPDYKLRHLPAPVNSKYMDYAPAIADNDSVLVLTSHRPEGKGGANEPRNGEKFSDNFMFMRQKGNWVADTGKSDFRYLNTKVNDGAGVFNKEKTKYYYTSCSNEEACQLYLSNLVNGAWADPVALNDNINSPQYSSKQPALSFTGDTLWFVSDRPGGQGLNDIWMAIKPAGTEDWEEPVNLGAPINTPYVDMSPGYYAKDRLLFFASNGHEGFGGLDIFMVQDAGKGTITNLGLPFNTNRDDFGLVLGERTGYFASNRDGGLGNDDVYAIDPMAVAPTFTEAIVYKDKYAGIQGAPEPVPAPAPTPAPTPEPVAAVPDTAVKSIDVVAEIKDSKGKPKEGAEVELKDATTGTVEKTALTGPDGKAHFDNLPVKKYITAEKHINKKHIADSIAAVRKAERLEALRIAKEKADEARQAALQKAEEARLAALEKQNKSREAAAALALARAEIAKRRKHVADSIQTAKRELAAAKAREAAEARALAMAKAKEEAAMDKATAPEPTAMKTVITKSSRKATKVHFEDIYFDFDSHDLRPEALKTLDEVAAYAAANPKVQIELYAFTDNIGNAVYNAYLSGFRGTDTRNYLFGAGLGANRIVMSAKGTAKPAASNDNAIGRQLNRRVEIYVVGGPEKETATSAVAYISTSPQSLDEVAQRFGMSKDELKAMNNLSGNELKAYQPLRVRKSAKDQGVIADALLQQAATASEDKPETAVHNINPATPAKALTDGKYTANLDETIYTVARLFGMKADELKTLNNLTQATLAAGQQITVRPATARKGFYVVKAGDTFESIAAATHTNVNDLLHRNNLEGSDFYEGMLVKVLRSLNP